MKELRELIRELQEDHDLKQKEVANYLNIAQQTYSNYENGRRSIPVWVVTALAKLYKVSTDYMLGADISYYSGMNLNNIYVENVTVYDVMYEIQKLRPQGRRELIRYLHYLNSIEKQETSRKKSQG